MRPIGERLWPGTTSKTRQPRTLAGGSIATGLHFNLSHSEDWALLAVTTAGPVGVDVEHVRPLRDFDALVERFFSAREKAVFLSLTKERKPDAFFRLWTRKEAWLKATGEGLGGGLDRVEVTFLPGDPVRFVALPPGGGEVAEWSLAEAPAPPGFAAAVAVRRPGIQVSLLD